MLSMVDKPPAHNAASPAVMPSHGAASTLYLAPPSGWMSGEAAQCPFCEEFFSKPALRSHIQSPYDECCDSFDDASMDLFDGAPKKAAALAA